MKRKKILCFGDSNTYGYTPDKHLRYEKNIRWPGILDGLVQKYGFEVIEEGLCGRTTFFSEPEFPLKNGSEALPYILRENYPLSVVIVMLGTNDCKTRFRADSDIITQGMEIIVNQIKIFDSRTKILIISPIELKEGVWEDGYDTDFNEESIYVSRELKEKYRRLAQRNGCMFLAASDFAEADDTDREHLNAEGHKALSAAIFDVLKENLKFEE